MDLVPWLVKFFQLIPHDSPRPLQSNLYTNLGEIRGKRFDAYQSRTPLNSL